MQLNALNQFISLNLAVEPNTEGSNNGEVIFGYGHLNVSDRRLKTNIRRVPDQHVQRLFDAVEPQYYDRVGGGKDQIGFIAQDIQAAGKLGEALCKTMSGPEELLALDYQKLSVVLWSVVKGGHLLEQLARNFNVRDPRKLFQIARREFPDRRDLARRCGPADPGAKAPEPGEERSGGTQRPAASGPGGL
ncbi:hypothetical protein AK812_SmicGene12664 [Symbiodinium microadriaticum]|uniref:Peptidase S74 domain-containing protein n=1 Tax=Symbiodinium microadriaticum TaxID=2951 RepID=A0A1Q9EA47_SYMMI|nr:hypothetical protein AK812_SmicGene12664 [Symbiodinium microadriaticum]